MSDKFDTDKVKSEYEIGFMEGQDKAYKEIICIYVVVFLLFSIYAFFENY